MELLRLAAFSDGNTGGNPAGVHLSEQAISDASMQAIAAEIGYSETAFAYPENDAWCTRYFSPETEVPFCGHATIALGAALARIYGEGKFDLQLNNARIQVTGFTSENNLRAELISPPTQHRFDEAIVKEGIELFGLAESELAAHILPAIASAGANHLILPLAERKTLSSMTYDLNEGRNMMRKHDLTTIALVHDQGDGVFNVRNAFASGGVLEDPATGAAAAAFGGYLRDSQSSDRKSFSIIQGEDMGARSKLKVCITSEIGKGVIVSGTVRDVAYEQEK